MKGKVFAKIGGVVLAGMLGLTSVACGSSDNRKGGDTVYVTIINSGFGDKWIKEIADNYEIETGIKVDVYADENLSSSLNQKLQNSNDLDDLYLTQNGYGEYYKWVKADYLEDLTDLFQEKADGDEITLEEKFSDEKIRQLGLVDGKRYVANYYGSIVGLVYNQAMLNQIDSYGAYQKGVFPDTWQGFVDLGTAVNNSGLKKGSEDVKLLSWSAANGYMSWAFKALWAQLDPTGFEAFYDYDNVSEVAPESIANTQAMVDAINAIQSVLNPTTENGGYSQNSVKGATGQNHMESQNSFLSGYSVCCLTGSWFETEMDSLITDDIRKNIKFAVFPSATGDAKDRIVQVNQPGEFWMIPNAAANKDGAKAFLKYLLKNENLVRVSEITGSPYAFKYDMPETNLTEWGKQVFNIYNNYKHIVAASVTKVGIAGAMASLPGSEQFKKIAKGEYLSTGNAGKAIMDYNYKKMKENWADRMKSVN